MKNTIFKILIGIVVIIFTFSTGLWLGISFQPLREYISNIYQDNTESTEDGFSVEPIEETIDFISESALDKKSKEELLKTAIDSILSELDDEYTEYFTAEEYEIIMESFSGTMSGIGVVVTLDDEGQVVVVLALDGTPAYSAGIIEGDIIVEVSNTKIKDMALEKMDALKADFGF